MGNAIDDYWLTQKLDGADIADVFLARGGSGPDSEVVIKIISAQEARNPNAKRRFLAEREAAAQVNHPNIIKVLRRSQVMDRPFFVMQYAPGLDAKRLLQRTGQLPLDTVCGIVTQIANALDALHWSGLIHGDVKPTNILLDNQNRPVIAYLTDFGASFRLTGNGQSAGNPVVASYPYIAPERLTGSYADGRADQYSLACTAFELLTGAPPFLLDRDDLVEAHKRQPPPSLSWRRSNLTGEVDAVMSRALAKNPANRYPTCRDFAAHLATALGPSPGAMAFGSLDDRTRQLPTDAIPQATPSSYWSSVWSRATATVIAIAVVAATSALLLALRPWQVQPVLRPTGVMAVQERWTWVRLVWTSPVTGPIPSRYLIWQDGKIVGSVRGVSTSFRAAGLGPDTRYFFRVQAVRGGRRSTRSAPLPVTTATPPISASRLQGDWYSSFTLIKSWPHDHFFHRTGRTWNGVWTFMPACSTGACDVEIQGIIIHNYQFSGELHRSPDGSYSGTAVTKTFEYCDYADTGTEFPIDDILKIRVTPESAHTSGSEWIATAWSGTMTMISTTTPADNGITCSAYSIEAQVRTSS